MIFFSIKEFFYKLNTIGFILLLLPLVVFVFLYFHALTSEPAIGDTEEIGSVLMALMLILLFDLTTVHWLWRVRMKRIKPLNELAKKMDRYFMLVLTRSASYAGGSLVMALGFFLTESPYFTGFFMMIMIATIVQWPKASTFCRQLELRGSERDMVLFNRDLYKKKTSPIRRH